MDCITALEVAVAASVIVASAAIAICLVAAAWIEWRKPPERGKQ